MSLIDDVLITIDDSPKTREELENIFYETNSAYLFSALGRLLSWGYIQPVGRGRDKYYKISSQGDLEIKNNLLEAKNILNNQPVKMYLISISNSEKYKSEREKIRTFLKNRGFALVNKGLFVNSIADLKAFKEKLSKICLNSKIIIFLLNELPDEIYKLKVENLNKQYQLWIDKAHKLINNLPKDVTFRRLYSKILIYNLSLILKSDLRIYNINSNLNEPRKIYKKIRDYCYL